MHFLITASEPGALPSKRRFGSRGQRQARFGSPNNCSALAVMRARVPPCPIFFGEWQCVRETAANQRLDGGYWAYGVSHGHTSQIGPEAWTIIEGKLYFNYSKGVKKAWSEAAPKHIDETNQTGPGSTNEPCPPSRARRRKSAAARNRTTPCTVPAIMKDRSPEPAFPRHGNIPAGFLDS